MLSNPKRRSRASLCAVLVVVAWLAWSPNTLVAQVTVTPAPLTCAQLLPMVEKNLAAGCSKLDRDQLCYGSRTIAVEFADAASSSLAFAQPGDIVPMDAVKSIKTAPLNLERGEWGLGVLKLQANIPGSTAGQVATFILYGDVSIQNVTPPSTAMLSCLAATVRATYLRANPSSNGQQIQLLPPNTAVKVTGRAPANQWVQAEAQGTVGWLYVPTLRLACDVNLLPSISSNTPASLPYMSAFYFSTGAAEQSACKDIPPNGMLIQSPKGQKLTFRVNGVDITLGSTIFLKMEPSRGDPQVSRRLHLVVLEGQASAQVVSAAAGKVGQVTPVPIGPPQVALAGQELVISLGGPDGLQVIGSPKVTRVQSTDDIPFNLLCNTGKAIGLNVPCSLVPPATPRPRPAATRAPAATSPPQAGGPSCTFTVQRFAADQNPVPYAYQPSGVAAYCTTIRWDVEGVETVYFNGQGVVGHGAQQVCISAPTTYSLSLNCGGQTKTLSLTLNIQ